MEIPARRRESRGQRKQSVPQSEASSKAQRADLIPHPLLFSFAAEAVFSAVEEAFDVRLVLHDNEHSDNHSENHLAKIDAFEVVFRAEIAEQRENAEQAAPKNATDRHVFRRNCKKNPESECAKNCQRRNGEEYAKSSEHALATAETGKTGEAVAENHEEACDKRNPGAIISTTSCNLSFAHFLSNKRSEKALQKVHENNRERGLPAKHTECIREARILGAVITNVEILTFREFCYPYGAGDRPQQVRYWKTQ